MNICQVFDKMYPSNLIFHTCIYNRFQTCQYKSCHNLIGIKHVHSSHHFIFKARVLTVDNLQATR